MKNKKEFTLRNMYCRKAKRRIKRIMSLFNISPNYTKYSFSIIASVENAYRNNHFPHLRQLQAASRTKCRFNSI